MLEIDYSLIKKELDRMSSLTLNLPLLEWHRVNQAIDYLRPYIAERSLGENLHDGVIAQQWSRIIASAHGEIPRLVPGVGYRSFDLLVLGIRNYNLYQAGAVRTKLVDAMWANYFNQFLDDNPKLESNTNGAFEDLLGALQLLLVLEAIRTDPDSVYDTLLRTRDHVSLSNRYRYRLLPRPAFLSLRQHICSWRENNLARLALENLPDSATGVSRL